MNFPRVSSSRKIFMHTYVYRRLGRPCYIAVTLIVIVIIIIVVIVGNAETWRESIRENHPSRARIRTKWRACNSVTPVRDQTVGRRAAYLYTLLARRPVERRRSCRVVSRREEPKARYLSLSPSLSLSLSRSLLYSLPSR